jgi:RecB family exonuclease
MALLYPVAEPYALIAHQQFAAAGIPCNGPAGRRLGDTLTGTALLRLLDLPESGFGRDDVMAWLASAPVVERARGPLAPAGAWDTISRRAGVVAGPGQWEQRLGHHLARLLEQQAAGEDATGRAQAQIERDVERTGRLRLFVDELVAALEPPPRPTWKAFSAWAIGLVDRYLGGEARHGHWPEVEQEAWRSVREAIGGLADLDAMGAECDLGVFRRTVEQELDAPAARTGTFGTGVFIGPVAAAAGTDFDTVYLVGMAEGAFPAIGHDDALLPDTDRLLTEGELPGRDSRLADDHHAFIAAMSAARERVLLWPRAELRRGRASLPSRWLPAAAGRRAAVDSFEDGVRRSPAPASLTDRDLADLLTWTRAGEAVSTHVIATELPRLGRGWAVIEARQSEAFTRFDGNVAAGAASAAHGLAGRALSPTSLESYATCPMQYFLSRVLHLGAAERPEEILSITALDKGTLIHRALEEYVVGLLAGEAPSLERLHGVADRLFDELEAKGLAGKPVLWRYEREVMRRELATFYDSDGLVPLAAELAFGLDGYEPVELTLPDGSTIAFRGRADRVDDDGDGGLVVTDYKTGRGYGYEAVEQDPVDRGRHLQLPLYGLAARQRFGEERPVRSRYRMVSERADRPSYDVEVTDGALARLREVTQVIAGGISNGAFLARPGDADYRGGWTNCMYCQFDRLCLEGRDVHWDGKKRATPALEAYVKMSEGGGDE